MSTHIRLRDTEVRVDKKVSTDGHQLVKIRRNGIESVVSMKELASILEHQL